MDDGHRGRDIPPDEDRLNYVYTASNGHDDLEEDGGLLNHHSNTSLSQCIHGRNGYGIQEPVDTTPDAVGRIYNHVFPSQRQAVAGAPDYYKSEENRLSTFSDWRYQNVVRKEDLAKNGFIYTGTGDKVRCVFCNGILRQWDQGDVVEQEHRRNFAQCPFISGQNVGNLPLLPGSPSPHQPRYLDVSNATSPRQMNRGLDIDPLEEGYGASCLQAQSQKGDPHEHDAVAVRNNTTSGYDLSPSGVYSSSPRNPHMAVEPERLATFTSWPAQMKQKPDELAQAGLFYTGDGDRVKCFHCDGVLYEWTPDDDPFVEHARWFPQCQYIRLVKGDNFVEDVQNGRVTQDEVMQTPAVLAVLYEGYSVELVKRALGVMRRKSGPSLVVTAQNLLTTVMELEDASKTCNGDVTSEDLKKLQLENESLRDRQLCKVCMEREVEVIFFPCKHLVCCAPCSAGVQACPICRVPIKAIDKIFMV